MTPDLYSLPHKALRVAVNRAGTLLAATDEQRLDADLTVVRGVIDDVRAHGAHEDEFIHPLLMTVAPDLEAELAQQHRDLESRLAELERHMERLAGSAEVSSAELALVSRAFQRYTAANLWHLDIEESLVMPTLWRSVTGSVLADLLARFHAAHPEAGAIYRRWPDALSPTDRQLVGVA